MSILRTLLWALVVLSFAHLCAACPSGKYGPKCASDCHCRTHAACFPTDGGCVGGAGCAQGYQRSWSRGDNYVGCATKCAGTFWYNCEKTCHCKSVRHCSTTTGVCNPPGCADGWLNKPNELQNCQTPCPDGKFGPECRLSCNCQNKTEGCRNTDGSCKSGCRAGWTAEGCQTRCGAGSYGLHCANTCNCKTKTEECNQVDGSCISGCPVGYMLPNCLKRCSGRFGPDCAGICHCFKNTECSATDGSCSGECEGGWTNSATPAVKNCQTGCPNGTFGLRCSFRCRCRKGDVCAKTDGRCASGCPAGWRGTGCQSACNDMAFGLWCIQKCDCADPTEVCNKVNGSCPISGRNPPKLTTTSRPKSTASRDKVEQVTELAPIYIYIGLSALACLLQIVTISAVIAICIVVQRKIRDSSKPHVYGNEAEITTRAADSTTKVDMPRIVAPVRVDNTNVDYEYLRDVATDGSYLTPKEGPGIGMTDGRRTNPGRLEDAGSHGYISVPPSYQPFVTNGNKDMTSSQQN